MQDEAGIDFGAGTALAADVEVSADLRCAAADELIARAQLICGTRQVITDPAVVEIYRRDATGIHAPAPLMVVLPASGPEVAGLVSACFALSLGWTVRGAGTSSDGSALPRAGSAMIVMTRMRRVLRPLTSDGEITVEPGVSVAMLRSICGESIFPGVGPSATVGGHLASTRGLRGVSGIELVEPDGSIAHAGPRQPGYDLAGAFCGSRGLEGIAVAISLRTGELTGGDGGGAPVG